MSFTNIQPVNGYLQELNKIHAAATNHRAALDVARTNYLHLTSAYSLLLTTCTHVETTIRSNVPINNKELLSLLAKRKQLYKLQKDSLQHIDQGEKELLNQMISPLISVINNFCLSKSRVKISPPSSQNSSRSTSPVSPRSPNRSNTSPSKRRFSYPSVLPGSGIGTVSTKTFPRSHSQSPPSSSQRLNDHPLISRRFSNSSPTLSPLPASPQPPRRISHPAILSPTPIMGAPEHETSQWIRENNQVIISSTTVLGAAVGFTVGGFIGAVAGGVLGYVAGECVVDCAS